MQRALAGAVAAAALVVAPARALEAEGRVIGAVIGSVERGRPAQAMDLDAGTLRLDGWLRPTEDDAAAYVFAAAEADVRVADWLSLRFGADTGLIRERDGAVESGGRPIGEEASATLFLRTAWADVTAPDGAFGLGVGRRAVRVAEGLLFDEYATGIEAYVGLGDFALSAGLWVPGRDLSPEGEPFVVGELAYAFDFLSRVAVFAAMHRDSGETARALGEQLVVERRATLSPADLGDAHLLCNVADGEARPWWIGATADLVLEGHTLRGAVLAGRGEARVDLAADRSRPLCRAARDLGSADLDLRALAADVTWRARAGASLWPGAFALYHGGGTFDGGGGTYTSFLSIDPYSDRPVVFFDAGLAAGYAPRAHRAAGVAGRGLVAAGPTLLFSPDAALEVHLLAAALFADAPGPLGDARRYGEELDARATWRPTEGLALSAEAGAWRLGDFFPEEGTVWQARLGLRAEWPP